jgi:predicted nucleic acid-binding protein
MEDRIFVDTNIWIYALTESKVEADKKKRKGENYEMARFICV